MKSQIQIQPSNSKFQMLIVQFLQVLGLLGLLLICRN